MFTGRSVLVTGGTGSFGRAFIAHLLTNYPKIKRIIVYSRDELKQYEMSCSPIFKEHSNKLRYFIGDVRDRERLKRACEGVDCIIHSAALKQVPAAEYNPMECIKTNIIGAENIIESALDSNVTDVIALSTDKASAPINLYGATKLCSDKLFVAANNMKGKRNLKLSVVRYGNVLGSRGSVIPYFLNARKNGFLNITHEQMTRFSLSLEDGVQFVMKALDIHWGGEIFIPKIPSYKILDIAEAVAPGIDKRIIGIRPGEKLHEEMITENDSLNTVEFNNYYVITPSTPTWNCEDFEKKLSGNKVPMGFRYNSGSNTDWLSIQQIRDQIKLHIDPNFMALT